MLVERSTLWCKILSAAEAERAKVEEYLARENGAARWSNGPDHYPLIRFDGSFRSGLLPVLQWKSREWGFEIGVVDKRQPVTPRQDWESFIAESWLRHDQKEVVAKCVRRQIGVVKCPTSYGKGECIVALFGAIPCHWLLQVPNKDLLGDTVERVRSRLGEPCGAIGDGMWSEARITVATYQTLFEKRRDVRTQALLQRVRGFQADEAHHLGGTSAYAVASMTVNADYRLGWSATAFDRPDDRNLFVMGATGALIHEAPMETVTETKVAAQPIVHLYPYLHEPQVRHLGWPDCYDHGVVAKGARNRLVIELTRRAKKPCLLSFTREEHGRNLLEMAQAAGLRAEMIFGNTPTKQRIAAIERCATGVNEVLIASVVLNQGQPTPLIRELRSIVNAAAGESAIRTTQRAGRGMRLTLGKTEIHIYDILDRGQRHLAGHADGREATYLKAGMKVLREQSPLTGTLL